MSRLDPPQVLIERTALLALAQSDHPDHAAVSAAYTRLLERYRTEQILLVAVDRHLRVVAAGPEVGWRSKFWFFLPPRVGRFAPIDPLRAGSQHHTVAARLTATVGDFDLALTLVMCQRERVRRMLTLDPRFADFDLELETVSAELGADE